MSPIPPNKETTVPSTSGNHVAATSGNEVNLVTEENTDLEEQSNENESIQSGNQYYTALPQQPPSLDHPNANEEGEYEIDNEAESEDSDDESEIEVNPDLDFELLASSRAFQKPKTTDNEENCPALAARTAYTFEHDYFERKTALECEQIEIDDEKSNKIATLMSGFKLPESAIPDWAKLVPEETWKQNLLESINAKKTDLFENKNEIVGDNNNNKSD